MNTINKSTETIGDRVRACRNKMGYSQENVAAMLYMKKATVCKYEKNITDIPASAVIALAKLLHTTPDYLLLGDTGTDNWLTDMIGILAHVEAENCRKLIRKQVLDVIEVFEK